MGGSSPSKEQLQSMDQVKQASLIQEISHPVFGKLAICNCLFNNGKKGLAYKKDVIIESAGIAMKLLELSKLTDTSAKDHFLTVYGYSSENHAALVVLKKDNSKHGNITPSSVFSAESRYKTYHPDVLKPVTGDNLTKFLSKQKHYAAPEVLKPYIKNSAPQQPKPFQAPESALADVYSLGLVLLELCSLKLEKDFYKPDFSVNKELIQSKLTDISTIYRDGFMEMIIRMLTIDPSNRITAEQLVELTTISNTPNDRSAITPRPPTQDNLNVRQETNGNSFSSGVPPPNFQFKAVNQPVEDACGVSAIRIQKTDSINQSSGIQRSASSRNLFDPEMLNRVNTNKNGSRIAEKSREISPTPVLPPQTPGNLPQRLKLDGSAISTSRIRRGDPSKSPLRKVYGSNFDHEGQAQSKPAHVQSMQHIGTSSGLHSKDPALDSVTANLNNMFYQHHSGRQIPQQLHHFGQPTPLAGFINEQSAFPSHYTRGISPLQFHYPGSNAINGFHQVQPVQPIQGLPQSQPANSFQRLVNLLPPTYRQEVVSHDVSPIQVPRRDPVPGVVTAPQASPITGRYTKVTRYSIDKNGQRTLIEGEPGIRKSNHSQKAEQLGSYHARPENQIVFSAQNGVDQPTYMPPLQLHNLPASPTVDILPSAIPVHHDTRTPRTYGQMILNEPTRNISPAPITIRSNSASRLVFQTPSQALQPPASHRQGFQVPPMPPMTQMPPLPPKHGEMPHSQSQPKLQQPVQFAQTVPVSQEPVMMHQSPQTPVLGPMLGAPNTPESPHQPPAQLLRKDSQQEFAANRTAKVPGENVEGLQLIEKVYVRDQDGNTVELKTFLCPDGGTKTERRIAINYRGELQGKFKETGVDLKDVVLIDQLEINRLIQENTMKSAQKVFGNAITPTKDNVKHGKNVPQSGEKDDMYSPMQPFQFSTFQQPQATVMTPETQPQAARQPLDRNYQSAEKENLNKPSVQKPSQASPLAMKNQNLGEGKPTGTQVADMKEPASPSPSKKVTSTKEQATLNMPPSLANSIKGKSIKVRYKDFKGKAYPVAVSGPDLTKVEKDWLLRKIIEKEGLTIEEVEEMEGGHLIDADDGSEYRLTADKDNLQNDLANHSDAFSKNNRASNLVKDIQNQIINEQDEELVSRSSVYTSNRVVGGQNEPNAAVQKFDLMHRPPESVNSRNDEIWFRTKEQKVIEDAEQYRHIDMSKSSNKSPMMAHYHDSAMAQMFKSRVQAVEYESIEKGVSTKFNYGTNQQYNPGFSSKYEAGSDNKGRSGYKEQEDEGQYDPSDIDALLKHNENLLSKIKIDMKNIGESFVSHTDMGSSRMGLKNSLAGAYLHRNPEFDSKDLINRSPIGIQEFESFKTKTHEEKFKVYSPQTGLKQAFDGVEGNEVTYENHRRRVEEIWERTMNSTTKSKTYGAQGCNTHA